MRLRVVNGLDSIFNCIKLNRKLVTHAMQFFTRHQNARHLAEMPLAGPEITFFSFPEKIVELRFSFSLQQNYEARSDERIGLRQATRAVLRSSGRDSFGPFEAHP